MELHDVVVIDLMRPDWRRWMIYRISTGRYWSKGRWRKRRRDGELWHDKVEAEKELQMVRLGS
jgi:hypothetical protein